MDREISIARFCSKFSEGVEPKPADDEVGSEEDEEDEGDAGELESSLLVGHGDDFTEEEETKVNRKTLSLREVLNHLVVKLLGANISARLLTPPG